MWHEWQYRGQRERVKKRVDGSACQSLGPLT